MLPVTPRSRCEHRVRCRDGNGVPHKRPSRSLADVECVVLTEKQHNWGGNWWLFVVVVVFNTYHPLLSKFQRYKHGV